MIEKVQDYVNCLPADAIEVLLLGPDDDGCGVCEAMYDLQDTYAAALKLLKWHVESESGVVTYLRCVYIYQCAGWMRS